MKLTIQQLNIAKSTHDLYWASYLNGDIGTLVSILDEQYTQIGSVENEVFSNKKDATQFVMDTIDQIVGYLQMRNRTTKIGEMDGLVLVTELCDLFVLSEDEWIFYSKFRASSLMKMVGDQWKIIHQHSSLPDSKAGEGENIALEKVTNENLQLHEAVKRRTIELEYKNRKLEIETALEKVRTVAMGMKEPKDMLEVCKTISQQLQFLGVKEIRNIQTAIFNVKKGTYMNYEYYAKHNKTFITDAIYTNHKLSKAFGEKMLKGKGEFFITHIKGKKVKEWLAYQKKTNVFIDKFLNTADSLNYYWYSLGSVALGIATYFPLIVEEENLFKRFLNVFELAYRRYLDIQKAEAQAREAKIETALEKIRSRTMAMQNSNELPEAANLLFLQVQALGIPAWSAGYNILAEDKKSATCWMSSEGTLQKPFQLRLWGEASFDEMGDFLHSDKTMLVQELGDKALDKHYAYMKSFPDLKSTFDDIDAKGLSLPTYQINHLCRFTQGFLLFITYEKVSESQDIFKRFTKVFEQTYTRFLDLQKAEAQVREAKIEASLERVRGKAMAMHSSEDLAATIGVFYHELETLSITPRRCGVGLIDKENHTGELSTMNTKQEGGAIELVGKIKLYGHPVLEGIYDNWILQKDYHPVLRGNEIKEYYQVTRPQMAFPEFPDDNVQYGYFFFFSEGGVYAWTEQKLSDNELKTYRRFTSVLSLTYKRYKDITDAEARAREIVKQATLDRVRAEIASMRTVGDLDRITPLIWRELTTLGIPFVRCGVFIMDDVLAQIHTFLSSPDGKAITAFHLPYGTSNFAEVEDYWREKNIYITHWGETEFSALADVLVQQKNIAKRGQYLSTLPKDRIHLHFLPFLQGMLYVGNTAELAPDDLQLVQSLADAFSTAYARYEDFTKMEAAKQQVDKTLKDLRATQNQLVQSEKMASLGELTAGIAHEIQNPLNFVNNFSEVSYELIDEVLEERRKEQGIRDEELEAELLIDIKQNLQKINHHGQRASSIVKGMLEHSRASTGKKEPTDINALCNEYMRLAYHGLRAKDKDFNVTMETNFNTDLPKIEVATQDISRVILNIINNAFYAVNERSKSGEEGYEPTVTITTLSANTPTSQHANTLTITISDNGLGIPDHIKDKIFQPFFTTKPTGSGTGLGLSLAYDIVTKGHGGELRVETKEGEGSTFIIQLPAIL
jgi:signal transduction histidine kinase